MCRTLLYRAAPVSVPAAPVAPIRTLVSLLCASLALLPFAVAALSPAAADAASCGATLVSGSSWLGGDGVTVHSNGASQGTANSCAGYSVASPPSQYGYGWQCVELAARLYYVRGWGERSRWW